MSFPSWLLMRRTTQSHPVIGASSITSVCSNPTSPATWSASQPHPDAAINRDSAKYLRRSVTRGICEMIADRYLSPITGWRVDTDLSLDNVKVRHGDFVESQLARVVNTPLRNHLLVKAYRDYSPGRRTIVFCVDVAHA